MNPVVVDLLGRLRARRAQIEDESFYLNASVSIIDALQVDNERLAQEVKRLTELDNERLAQEVKRLTELNEMLTGQLKACKDKNGQAAAENGTPKKKEARASE